MDGVLNNMTGDINVDMAFTMANLGLIPVTSNPVGVIRVYVREDTCTEEQAEDKARMFKVWLSMYQSKYPAYSVPTRVLYKRVDRKFLAGYLRNMANESGYDKSDQDIVVMGMCGIVD